MSWALRLGLGSAALAVSGLLVLGAYVSLLDWRVRDVFEGRRWSLPARVFSRPLEIYAGQGLRAGDLVEELRMLRYRKDSRLSGAGTYWPGQGRVTLRTRGFPFPEGEEPARQLRVSFKGGAVRAVIDRRTGKDLGMARLEPVPIANIYPRHNEDRILVHLDDAPPLLIQTLLAVEDHDFYEHFGLDPSALARALWVNLKAGRTVQGGSTLTQQLVKNLFLSNERTLWRRFNEAVMTLLLEHHYSKDEILQAYLNEVYLGQDGKRAIHGFALASQFYFEKRLQDLSVDQLALLVGLVRGPSLYAPRRHPERARARRDLVLSVLVRQGVIGAREAERARQRPLGVSRKAPSGTTPFPAYLQLVRRELERSYRKQDLRSDGLMIFTTLDPIVQLRAEQALTRRLAKLDKRAAGDPLQAAVVVAGVDTGEVVALVGGRNPRFAGYNRALDIRRPIGSLIKPVVYLTALSDPEHYTLATLLEDAPLSVRLPNGKRWSPHNYDRRYHGQVPIHDALAHSYNVPTARLGLRLGVEQVTRTLYALGVTHKVAAYPSVLLGAAELPPIEVAQIYQTLGARGTRMPLTAVLEVTDREGRRLPRNPPRIRQVADPEAVYLVDSALYETARRGTARALSSILPKGLRVAGKTGTTNELRDSWFAGFSAEHVAVVWVGHDDNRPTGLTGASGALRVWGDIIGRISTRSLDLDPPEGVKWRSIDPHSGLLADQGCDGAVSVPFVQGSAPVAFAPCAHSLAQKGGGTLDWLEALFD